jgi:hypothetical protein
MIYLLIFLTPVINFILFEAFFFRAGLFYAVLAVSSVLLLIAVRRITGKKINTAEFWNFSIFPILFSGSLAAYSLLIVNHFIIHFLFVLCLVFNYFYLKNIYRGEEKDFLESISSYGNLLIVFFSFAAIFGFEAFLGLPIWMLVIGSAVVVMLVVYQIFWVNKIKENVLAYAFLAGLLMTEIIWAVYFLPFNFNTLGLLAAICYYLMIGFVKLSLAEKLTARNIKFYLVTGSIFLILILLTAKWA